MPIDDPYAGFEPVEQPAAPARSPGFIPGIPKERLPPPKTSTEYAIDQARLDEMRNPKPTLPAGYQMGPNGKAVRIPGLPPEKVDVVVDPLAKQVSSSAQVDHVLTQIGRVRKQIDGGMAAGNVWGSDTFQHVPVLGQRSADLHATLDGIQGSVINDTVAQLKAQSANGSSGYGALSETEATRLAASVASLHQTQSPAQLKKGLDDVERHYRIAKVLLGLPSSKDDFNKAVLASIQNGADLSTVESLYKATGRPFPPESARHIANAIARKNGAAPRSGVSPDVDNILKKYGVH